MSKSERNGSRRPRERSFNKRNPELGYYIIVTDTKETEQNYMHGLRNSIPKEMQRKLVIIVKKTETKNLVDEALNSASLCPQYGEIWIIFDRDQVQNFDEIISEAINKGINVAWTNPCIEEWFCAYFGSMPVYSNSVSCCNGFEQIFANRTQKKYSKADPGIYEILNRFGDEKKAISIAEQKMKEHGRNEKKLPSEQCPGTTVHLLVEEIKSKVCAKNKNN